MKESKIIAVDFDGTCVRHEYPEVGEDVPMAVEVLRKLREQGHRIILWTMRSSKEQGINGSVLADAVSWFSRNGIDLYAVNENPAQDEWTSSPKVFANIYIDDAALGCPLIRPTPFRDDPLLHLLSSKSLRPFVDWQEVERYLIQQGVIP